MEKLSDDETYEKYTKILDITLRTCATMLAIVFAYTLGARGIVESIRPLLIALTICLIVTIFLSGATLVSGSKEEPKTLRNMAIICFGLMLALTIGMLLLLIYAIYG